MPNSFFNLHPKLLADSDPQALTDEQMAHFLGISQSYKDLKNRQLYQFFSSRGGKPEAPPSKLNQFKAVDAKYLIGVGDPEGDFEYYYNAHINGLNALGLAHTKDTGDLPEFPEGLTVVDAGDMGNKAPTAKGDQAVLDTYRRLKRAHPILKRGLYGNRDLIDLRSGEINNVIKHIENELKYLKENPAALIAEKDGKCSFKTGLDRQSDLLWVDGSKELPGQFLIKTLLKGMGEHTPYDLAKEPLEEIIRLYEELLEKLKRAEDNDLSIAKLAFVTWQMMMSKGTVIFGDVENGNNAEHGFMHGSAVSRALNELLAHAKTLGKGVSRKNLIATLQLTNHSNRDFYLKTATALSVTNLPGVTVLHTHGSIGEANFGKLGEQTIPFDRDISKFCEEYNKTFAERIFLAREELYSGSGDENIKFCCNMALPGPKNNNQTAIQSFYDGKKFAKGSAGRQILETPDLILFSGHKPQGPLPVVERPFLDSAAVIHIDTCNYRQGKNWSVAVAKEDYALIEGEVSERFDNIDMKPGKFRYQVHVNEKADLLQGLALFDAKQYPEEKRNDVLKLLKEFCEQNKLELDKIVNARVLGINLADPEAVKNRTYTCYLGGFKYKEFYVPEMLLLDLASKLSADRTLKSVIQFENRLLSLTSGKQAAKETDLQCDAVNGGPATTLGGPKL